MKNIVTMNKQIVEPAEVNLELYNQYIEFVDASPKTIETYGKALKQFFLYLMANNINYPERADVIAFRENLKATGHRATTIQNYITAVRLFFKWTAQQGIYPNIAENVKGAKISKNHKKDNLTSSQVKSILDDIDRTTEKGARDYAMLSLAATCGLRTIELNRANVEDLRALGDDVVLYVQGKGRDEKADSERVPPLTEKAIRNYLAFRGKLDGTAPLFASTSNNNRGGRMTTRAIRSVIKTRFQNAGYDSERLTAHSLRHTAVTLALLSGGSLDDVQDFARHESIATTMIYNHTLEMRKNNCSRLVEDAIFR